MRMRAVAVAILSVALVVLIPGVRWAEADSTPPPCYDRYHGVMYTATKWLTSPGTLVGTPGPDVLVGSTGRDTILGLGGDDVICSAPTGTASFGDPDVIDGGTGNDLIFGVGHLKGSAGDDLVETRFIGGLAEGGTGQDYVVGAFGASASGGAGDDFVSAGYGGTADGGSGDDHVEGLHAGALLGGSGNDTVISIEYAPETRIDCGSGHDQVSANGATNVRGCEQSI
jgi:hypothetical protein